MISNKDLFLRAYKKQNNLNPDVFLPPSTNRKIIQIKKVKGYKPRNVTVATRYGDVSISNSN